MITKNMRNSYFDESNKVVTFEDDLNIVSNYTTELIEGYVATLKSKGLDLEVYKHITKKKYVLYYLGVFSYFDSLKELCLFLEPTYKRCKEAIENDYYKKLLRKCFEEKEF